MSVSTQNKVVVKNFLPVKLGIYYLRTAKIRWVFSFSPILMKLPRVLTFGVYEYLPKTRNPSYKAWMAHITGDS